MRVIDLDNEYHNWKISGHISKNNDLRPRSKYHLRARNLIKEEFPTCQILEEVPVRARKGETLYLDLWLKKEIGKKLNGVKKTVLQY